MRKLLGLAMLLAVSFVANAQVRNTGVRIRLKGPIYQDAVLLVHKNLLMVRAEAPFYAFAYANDTYKTKPGLPVLLGLRYERLGASDIGLGFDLEYTAYNAKKLQTDAPFDLPKDQRVIKFSPYLKKYIRTNRKAIFRGLYFTGGLTYLSVNQVLTEQSKLLNAKDLKYKRADFISATLGAGIQHTFGEYITVGFGGDISVCQEQFIQETWTKIDIGNGALYFNPWKFYIGAHF